MEKCTEVLDYAINLRSPLFLQNLDLGYVLEYKVQKEAASLAEIKVDIASAGHWFGGGNLPHFLALEIFVALLRDDLLFQLDLMTTLCVHQATSCASCGH